MTILPKKNQLFRKIPPLELVERIVKAFGLKSLDDETKFSRNDLDKINTVSKITEMKSELEKYYIPCKSRTYLNDLNKKNVITILRQCVKLYDYLVSSKEKYSKGEKFIVYQLKSLQSVKDKKLNKPLTTIEKTKKNIIISFD